MVPFYLFLPQNASFLSIFIYYFLVFISPDALYPILTESHFSVVYCWLYRLFIGIHNCVTALEFEEYYLTESSLRQSIEYDIVTSLPDEYHILRCVWEVRKCREYLLIDFSEYTTPWSPYGAFAYFSMLVHGDNSHDKNPNHETNESTEYECEGVHFYFLAFNFRLFVYYLLTIKKQIWFPSSSTMTQ